MVASSPVLMKTFAAVFANVHSGSFAEGEIQIVLLTDAVANASAWVVAFHSALALQNHVTDEDVRAIRERRLPSVPKHAALLGLARQLIDTRGHVSAAELKTFLNAWQHLSPKSADRVRQPHPPAARKGLLATTVGLTTCLPRRQAGQEQGSRRCRAQAGSPSPSHLDHARAVCTLLRKGCLRDDHVHPLRRHRVPMTASAFWS